MNIQDKHFSNQLNAYLDSQFMSLAEESEREWARNAEKEIAVANEIQEMGDFCIDALIDLKNEFNDLMSIDLETTDPHKVDIKKAVEVLRCFITLQSKLEDKIGEHVEDLM